MGSIAPTTCGLEVEPFEGCLGLEGHYHSTAASHHDRALGVVRRIDGGHGFGDQDLLAGVHLAQMARHLTIWIDLKSRRRRFRGPSP